MGFSLPSRAALREDGALLGPRGRVGGRHAHTHTPHTLVHMRIRTDSLTTPLALQVLPPAHTHQGCWYPGNRSDVSEALQLVRPVPLTLPESMMRHLQSGGGGHEGKGGATQARALLPWQRIGLKTPHRLQKTDIWRRLLPLTMGPETAVSSCGLSDGGGGGCC